MKKLLEKMSQEIEDLRSDIVFGAKRYAEKYDDLYSALARPKNHLASIYFADAANRLSDAFSAMQKAAYFFNEKEEEK